MANPHFGEIGDVWKHLVLGDLLDRLRPSRYCETHAGSGTYPLTRAWEREYGIYMLLREAPRAPAIEASRYVWLIRTLPPGEDEQPRYPGSARLAMEVLGGSASYLLCDLDAASVADLVRSARELDLGDLVRVQRVDGIATIRGAVGHLASDAAASTFVFIDPLDEEQRSADGMDSLDLFGWLAARGSPVALWRGYDDVVDRDEGRSRSVVEGVATHAFDVETAFLNGTSRLYPGVGGCAMMLANVEDEHLDHVERLGRQLAALYDDAVMPDGSPGALTFTRTDLG